MTALSMSLCVLFPQAQVLIIGGTSLAVLSCGRIDRLLFRRTSGSDQQVPDTKRSVCRSFDQGPIGQVFSQIKSKKIVC